MVAATPGLTYVSAANRFDVFIPGANGVIVPRHLHRRSLRRLALIGGSNIA